MSYYQISHRKSDFDKYTLLGYAYGEKEDIIKYYRDLYRNFRLDDINVTYFKSNVNESGRVYCVIYTNVIPKIEGFFIGEEEEIKEYYMEKYKINKYDRYGPKIIVTPLEIVIITKDDLIKKCEIDSELVRISKKIMELQKYSDNLRKQISIPVASQDSLFYGENKPSRHRCKGCGKEPSYADAHVIEGSMGNYYTC